MRVNTIQIAECSVPLQKALKLGPVLITSRDFVVLRAITDSGLCGDAIGYPRGAALLDETKKVASYYLGSDPFNSRASWELAGGRLVNNRAVVMRGLALLDVAMHDLVARRLEQPLHKLLGGYRDEVPVMAVAGYFLNERSIDDVAREVSELLDKGYQRVKVMLSGSDPDFDFRFARTVAELAPGRIAVDAHWSWSTLAEALRTCRRLDDLGLAFIEDPFGPFRHAQLPALASRLRTPLAAGEDMPGAESLTSLCDNVGILRVDATTCGGVKPAQAAIEAAALRGCAVLPHIWPTLHAQLAGALPGIEMIEHIPSATGADPIGELVSNRAEIVDGACRIGAEPGAGVVLDWDAVERYAVRAETLDARAPDLCRASPQAVDS